MMTSSMVPDEEEKLVATIHLLQEEIERLRHHISTIENVNVPFTHLVSTPSKRRAKRK